MKRLALFLLAGAVGAQAQAARDVSVRLFDTDRVSSVTVTPISAGASWKTCARCAAVPVASPFTVMARSGGLMIGDIKTATVTILGEVRLETDSHRRAAAAAEWTIDPERDGLRVRVVLPSERYVAAVLAGETESGEPPASLRSMAIVVRSFALARAAKGQELCDSTRCQAMRLGGVSPAISQAVRETAGETLWFHGSRVAAYFTQSSGGITESSAAAWGGPAESWLPSQADPASERTPSQWHAEVPLRVMKTALAAEGFVLHTEARQIRIAAQTASGRARQIVVQGDGGERLEIPAASFRFAIGRSLGWNLLRSDLYQVHLAGAKAIFDGKGFGHGVGLSQSGAKILASQGWDERRILRFYFPGTEVRISAADTGWQTKEISGWKLHFADEKAASAAAWAGDAAWQKALALLPPRSPIQPDVRLFPTTDLYRGSTGEPGWTLASTRGDLIALQPPNVVARNRPAEDAYRDLLLHEMLHVLVETQGAPSLPLWYREGLVEVLAEPSGPEASTNETVSATESHLARPQTFQQAESAHREAAALVRRLRTVYGGGAVLGWLRTGVPNDALQHAGLK